MSKRIVLDLTKCEGCESCTVACGYFYRPHDTDHGIQTLKERATFIIVCRRCKNASCVAACPYQALERQPEGVIKRYNLRCVSCKLCTQACPFGTIYPEMVGYYVTPCDYCTRRSAEDPPCVRGCARNAITHREVDPAEEQTHIIDEYLAVIAPRWEKEKV
jgi:Fe-S-cluster-containing dehydrogenase component